MENCLLCSSKSLTTRQDNSSRTIYNCVKCGIFVVSDLAVRAIRQNKNQVWAFLHSHYLAGNSETVLVSYENAKVEKDYLQMTVAEIVEFFPKTFNEQMQLSLINLTRISAYPGDEIKIEHLDVSAPSFYLKNVNFDALSFVIKAMARAELIEVSYYGASFFPCGVTVSPKGWDVSAELAGGKGKGSIPSILLVYNSAWAGGGVDTVRAAAQKAARDCGAKVISKDLSAGLVGENEIATQVKASAYLVIDLSSADSEIFYAWGFARAIGKPILLTCSDEKRENVEHIVNSGVGITFWKGTKQLPAEMYNFIKAHE